MKSVDFRLKQKILNNKQWNKILEWVNNNLNYRKRMRYYILKWKESIMKLLKQNNKSKKFIKTLSSYSKGYNKVKYLNKHLKYL